MLDFAETPRTLAELEDFVDEAAVTVDGSSPADHAPGGVTRVPFRMVGARGGLVHVAAERALALARQGPLVAAPSLDMPDEETALDEAVVRYLRAYGPVSVADFGQWSGQRRVTSKAAIDRLERSTGRACAARTAGSSWTSSGSRSPAEMSRHRSASSPAGTACW